MAHPSYIAWCLYSNYMCILETYRHETVAKKIYDIKQQTSVVQKDTLVNNNITIIMIW